MPKNAKVYDFIFSLGQACSCTEALRKSKLQYASYPLDWISGSNLSGRVNLLTTNFKDFINLEDLKYIATDNNTGKDIYNNIKNSLFFNHDFSANTPIEKSYSEVFEKYKKRIKRLFKNINKSKHVLGVYIEYPYEKNIITDNSILQKAQNKLATKFKNCSFDILYIYNDESLDVGVIKKEYENKNIIKMRLNYTKLYKSQPAWAVNEMAITNALNLVQLKNIRDFIYFKKLKRGLGIYILRKLFNIVRLKFIIFGFRFDFCIGKIID